MPPARDDRSAALPGPPSWGAIADAVGHCMLVFAFLPPVAVIPGWVVGEARNAFNLQDPVVLAFLPARGTLALLDAFRDGIAGRLIAGVLAGLLLTGLASRRGVGTAGRRLALGALCGGLAGAATMAVLAATGPAPASFGVAVVGAIVCGAVATPGAVRLLCAAPRPDALQCDGASPSAFHQ